MSGVTMNRSLGEHTAGPQESSPAGGQHSDHEHDHDDGVAPLRESRPRSSRGLLRKDTPAILVSNDVRKDLFRAEVHHSPLVTEEEEADEDEEDDENKVVNKPVSTASNVGTHHTRSTTKTATETASAVGVVDNDARHEEEARNIVRRSEPNHVSPPIATVHDQQQRGPATSPSGDSTNITTSAGTAGAADKSAATIDNAAEICEDSNHEVTPRGITVEYCDGTRPKHVQPINGSVRAGSKTDDRKEAVMDLTTAVKAKKPVVTFKERHAEGFHAQTKSGMKVLMRKETPASLPSVQKVKAAQRFRQTSASLTEENRDSEDEAELAEPAMAGACGEG